MYNIYESKLSCNECNNSELFTINLYTCRWNIHKEFTGIDTFKLKNVNGWDYTVNCKECGSKDCNYTIINRTIIEEK